MKIYYHKIKHLSVDDIYIQVLPLVKKIQKDYEFLEINTDLLEQNLKKEISASLLNFNENTTYDAFITEKIRHYFKRETKRQLSYRGASLIDKYVMLL